MAKENTAADAPVKEAEPKKEKMVTIRLPLTKDDQGDVFVRVNHRTWLIKRGENVTVPECVVKVLENSEHALMQALANQAKKSKG